MIPTVGVDGFSGHLLGIVRREERCGRAYVSLRRLMETDHGYERDGWRAINTALGLTAIRIPEAYGGYGLSFGDQCQRSPRQMRSIAKKRGQQRRKRDVRATLRAASRQIHRQ